MERDLGEFRSQQLIHRTENMQFHDDCLVLRLNGPRSAAEFDGDTANSRSELTPFSRECASLWRELFGHRKGHLNAKGIAAAKLKRQKTLGTFGGAVRGVLVAARLAVLGSRKARRACSSASVVYPGAGTAESALWNEQKSNFQERSRQNIPGVTQTRVGPGAPFS